VVWGARRLYFNRPFSFWLDKAIYTRHGDGRFTTESGATVTDPHLLQRLSDEWRVVSRADLSAQTGRHAWPGLPADRERRSGFARAVEGLGRFMDRF
jgi:hypothetical protein